MTRLRLPLVSLFKSVIDEGRKVIWPSREMVIKHTGMVVVSVVVAVIVFASLDFGLSQLVKLALKQ